MCVCVCIPMLRVGVFEELGELQWVFADFLHGCEQEAIERNVDHLLEQTTSLEEEHILLHLHQLGELDAGVGVIVTVL